MLEVLASPLQVEEFKSKALKRAKDFSPESTANQYLMELTAKCL
jgi:hypothetical protein